MSNDDYARLDEAWAALDAGDPERALELTAGLDEELAETWILRATAALDQGDLAAARRATERASELEEADQDPELLLLEAEIDLCEWELDSARERLERALALGRSPVLLAKLALVADASGDFGGADRLLREAHKLDAQNFPPPPRLSEREFDEVVARAVAGLPDAFRAALEAVPVIVDPMPTRELAGDDPSETPPDVLGLFTGSSLAERSLEGASELPPTIHLFQRNVERSCEDRAELVEQIRVTLYHELGHYLGFDEEGVADLGLE